MAMMEMGGNTPINKRGLLWWLVDKKGAELTCPQCGTRDYNVKVVRNFKEVGTLCLPCYSGTSKKAV